MNPIKSCSFYPSQLKKFHHTLSQCILKLLQFTYQQSTTKPLVKKKKNTLCLGPKYKNTTLQLDWIFKQNFSYFKNQINKLSHDPTQVNKINIKLLGTAMQLILTIHGNNSKNLFTEPTHYIEIL